MDPLTRTFLARFEEEVFKKIEKMSRADNRSLNMFINLAVKKYIEDQEKVAI